ncbi:MAG TPA: hypothetical protein ENO21_03425 [Firmicutes bacterium]|nr:hypothetical protein [Bacillota bacterium]
MQTPAPPAYQTSDVFTEVPEIPWDDEGPLHGASETSGGQIVVPGAEYLLKHNAEVHGTSLVLTGRPPDQEGDGPRVAYGLYRVSGLGELHPLALVTECLPAFLGNHYFIGVADYTSGEWMQFGPISTPEYEVDLSGENHRFVSRLGNLYFVVVVPPGHQATHFQSTLFMAGGGGDDPALPGAPHELIATDGAFEDRVVVEWIADEGAAFYEVYRHATEEFHGTSDTDPEWTLIGSPETNRFVDEEVEPGRVYLYKARSASDAGFSEFSNIDAGYAAPADGGEGDPPGRPFELWATDGEFDNGVKVQWDGGEGAAWFRVARQDVEPESEWVVIGESEAAHYFDEEVVPGKIYRYKAQAVNEHGHSEWSNTDTGYAAGGTGGDPPAAPFELWASDGTYENGVKLEWAGGEGAAWFIVERRVAEGESEWHVIGDPDGHSFFDETAEPGVIYKYRVKAGNDYGESEYSNTDTGYRASGGGDPPGAPFELWATDGEFENGVKVQWGGGEGAAWFRIQRQDVEPATDWVVVGEAEGYHFFDDDVVPGKVYRYRAQAVNAHGQSDWSNSDTGFAKEGGGDGFKIVGSVKHGEGGLSCAVTLLVVGDDEVTHETGEGGGFAFENLEAGLYIVYPHHPEFLFSPPYKVFTLSAEHPVGEAHFSATVAGDTFRAFGFVYSLSGGEGGLELVPLGETRVVAWQEGTEFEHAVYTNEDGYFLFEDLPGGVVLFKPTREGYVFVPAIHDAQISGEGIPHPLNFRGHMAE